MFAEQLNEHQNDPEFHVPTSDATWEDEQVYSQKLENIALVVVVSVLAAGICYLKFFNNDGVGIGRDLDDHMA